MNMKNNSKSISNWQTRNKQQKTKNGLQLASCLLIACCLLPIVSCFAVIDTLRHHNPATSNSIAFINTIIYPSQYACFQPPAPGYIKSLVITLGGFASTGSATVHIFG